jgi:hypothetical protein
MSGGHFDYKQYGLQEVADTLIGDIARCKVKTSWREAYDEQVVERMEDGLKAILEAAVYMNRIDWLLSGDDGEDAFLVRLREDLKEISNE